MKVHQIPKRAVRHRLTNHVKDFELTRGQGEPSPNARSRGGVHRRPQAVGAVRPGLVEQTGHARVHTGLQVVGGQGVAARDQCHVGFQGLQALGGRIEDRATKGVGQHRAFGLERVERANKLVPKLDRRATHPKPVMTVGENDGAHAVGSSVQASA